MQKKKSFNSPWQEITKVIRGVLKNPALLKSILRLGNLIFKLLGYFDN